MISGAHVYLKLESEQITGSFKMRGAANKIRSASAKPSNAGFVSASTGNHGLALATVALRCPGVQLILFVPKNASRSKIEKIKRYGVHIKEYGANACEAEAFAKRYARENDLVWISPYNDEEIIAGQGTVGMEIYEQLPTVDAIFVTIGGGGLISGISSYFKSKNSKTQIIGCMPEQASELIAAIEQDRYIEPFGLDTIADGCAGGFEDGAMTLGIIRSNVQSYTLVTEEQIQLSMRSMFDHHHKVIEGAAGVALAAFLRSEQSLAGKHVVVVICGANISRERYLAAIGG